MKVLKKIIFLLVILLLIGILNCCKVYASTNGKSAEDAINWARSLQDKKVGSGQCVAFISEYYKFLGQTTPSYYNAYELIYHVDDQPSGWKVIHDHNVQAQAGDILVYSGGGTGHVALYEADYAIWHANWGTDSGPDGTPVRWNGSYYKDLTDRYFEGVVRPDFNTDSEPPKFSNGELVLNSITANSYKVRVKVTDNVGVDYVNFAIKGAKDSSFGSWTKMTYNNGYYEATINTSKNDLIYVHCYAFDKAGNSTGYQFPNWAMGSKKVDLGNFTARIVSKGNSNYCIGITGTTNGDDLQLVTKNNNDSKQLWNFTKLSNGNYKIINATTSNQGFDVDGGVNADGNATPIQIWNHVDGATQQEYMIVSYNGGYRIMPSNTKLGMGLDVQNASYKNGTKIVECNVNAYQNNAQTWSFEKVTPNISMTPTSCTLGVGGITRLTVTSTLTGQKATNISYKSSNTSVATVDSTGLITGKGLGTATITATTTDGTNLSKTCKVTVKESTPHVQYKTHIQDIGWENSWKSDGTMSGTSGKSLRLEAIEIKLTDSLYSGTIQYKTHIQDIGWENSWKSNGAMSGTSGKAKRLEAIQIQLTGYIANYYDVYYRVHAQDFGWLDWAKNGELAGTASYGKRLEAIEIKLIRKTGTAPGKTTTPFKENLSVQYSSHVQNIGWQGFAKNGALSGTSGKSLRLEGLRIRIANTNYSGDIVYSTHVENIGWQSQVKNGAIAGTSGKSLRLEAMKINLTGDLAKHYDIYYRVHVQDFGWLDWAKNGEVSGTTGYAKRLEGLQIVLVEKGGKAPGSTTRHEIIKGK